MKLDKRINAYNEEIADISLKEHIKSKNYVSGKSSQIAISNAPIYQNNNDQNQISEALFGEIFKVFHLGDIYSFGQLQTDNYVGYIKNEALSYNVITSNYCAKALRTFLYEEPDIKSKIKGNLSFNSLIHVKNIEGGFATILHNGNDSYYVYEKHIKPINKLDKSPLDAALKFIETPYLWGGRSSIGLDCSALVQLAYANIGISLPRDSDLQEDFFRSGFGKKIGLNDEKQKGDLVFWNGHVAMFVDSKNIIHANAYHMKVIIEEYNEAKKRIEKSGNLTKSIYRII